MYKYRHFSDKNVDDNDWGLFIDIENVNEDLNKKNDYVNDYYTYYISIMFLFTYITLYFIGFI